MSHKTYNDLNHTACMLLIRPPLEQSQLSKFWHTGPSSETVITTKVKQVREDIMPPQVSKHKATRLRWTTHNIPQADITPRVEVLGQCANVHETSVPAHHVPSRVAETPTREQQRQRRNARLNDAIITNIDLNYADLTGEDVSWEKIDEERSRALMGLGPKIRARVDLTGQMDAVESQMHDDARSVGRNQVESARDPLMTMRREVASRAASQVGMLSPPVSPRSKSQACSGMALVTSGSSGDGDAASFEETSALVRRNATFEGFRDVRWLPR